MPELTLTFRSRPDSGVPVTATAAAAAAAAVSVPKFSFGLLGQKRRLALDIAADGLGEARYLESPLKTTALASPATEAPSYKSGTWSKAFDVLTKAFVRQEHDRTQKRTIYTRTQVSDRTFVTTETCAGDRIVAAIERDLDCLGVVRTEIQRKAHKVLLMTQLRSIYGKDFAANQKRLLEYFGVKKFPKAPLLTTPRQFGKTTLIGMFLIVAARHIPNWSATVFSPTGRQSDNLQNISWDFGLALPDGALRMKRRKERIFVFSSAAVAAAANKKTKGGAGAAGRKSAQGKTIRGAALTALDGSKSLAQQAAEDQENSTRAKSKLEFLPSNEHGDAFFLICVCVRVWFCLVCTVWPVLALCLYCLLWCLTQQHEPTRIKTRRGTDCLACRQFCHVQPKRYASAVCGEGRSSRGRKCGTGSSAKCRVRGPDWSASTNVCTGTTSDIRTTTTHAATSDGLSRRR